LCFLFQFGSARALADRRTEDRNPDEPVKAPTAKNKATNVIDLVAVLQESLQQSKVKVADNKKKAAASKPRQGGEKKAA
jgi:non-homologous end joining protein Ku